MSYQVKLTGTDIEFDVLPGESILDAATRHNIDLPYSCYSGICSTCKGTCLKGEYDYDGMEVYGLDVDDNPNNELLLCCAHPRSNMDIHHPDFSPTPEPPHLALVCDIVQTKQHGCMIEITLKPQQNKPLFSFWPGQYCLIELDGNEYPFSIVNTSNVDNTLELHIIDAPHNSGPEPLLSAIREKKALTIKGPFGKAHLHETSDAPILFVAGGSGIASIKPMIKSLINSQSSRDMLLYWGVREPAYLYLNDLFTQWAKDYQNFQYHPVISEKMDQWIGKSGLVHQAVLNDFDHLGKHHIYLSGPFEMVFQARDDFISARHAQRDQLFSDAFEFEQQSKQEWE